MHTDINLTYGNPAGRASELILKKQALFAKHDLIKLKKIVLATAFAMAATSAFAGNPAPATMEVPSVPAPEATSASGWVIPALQLIAIAEAANK